MADSDQLAIILRGSDAWNKWRAMYPDRRIQLAGADLTGCELIGADLRGAFLQGADLNEAALVGANLDGAVLANANLVEAKCRATSFVEADLKEARLHGAKLKDAQLNSADLSHASLIEAQLIRTNLTGAVLVEADLSVANLSGADLAGANLQGCNLYGAQLIDANVEGASLSGSNAYGVSAWNLKGRPADQADLRITSRHDVAITVDDLEVAQFVFLMLRHESLRDVIDTVTSKVVLILGRFTSERKAVLDALKAELRNRNLTPILFDFNPAEHQDITDTVTLLARMARFVIADLTDPMSVQQELTLIAPQVMVAIKPIILAGQKPWSMFGDLHRRSPGLLPVHEYQDLDQLLAGLQQAVIEPAEAKRSELLPARAAEVS